MANETNGNFEKFGTVKAEDQKLDWNSRLEDVPEDSDGLSFFRPIPEGEYEFMVDDLEYQTSKSGAPMILLKLIIPQPEKSVRVNDRLVLTKNAQWKLVQFWKSIGRFAEAQTKGMDWDHLPDAKGRLIISHRLYNGKTYNEVKRYVIPSAPAVAAPAQTNSTPW